MTLVYLGTGWLCGLVLATVCSFRWPVWLFLSLGPAAAAIIQRHDRRQWRLYLAVAFVLLGAARYRAAQTHSGPAGLAAFNDQGWGEFEGVVVADPDPRSELTRLTVAVEWMQLERDKPRQILGRVLLEAPRYPVFRYGDRLRFSGRLQSPPEWDDFSYKDYLALKGIHSIVRRPQIERLPGRGGSPIKRALYDLRSRAHVVVQRVLPEPEASLLSGILLGKDQGISDALMDSFRATGASHVIAISGYNISIVISLLFTGLGRIVPRRTAGLITIGAIAAYTVLVGAEAAVVRAAIMGSLLTAGGLLGRRAFGPALLMAAAIGMTLFDPLLVLDVGFGLSFAATLGLMVYAERFHSAAFGALARRIKPRNAGRIVRFLNDSLLLTVAAQMTALPLMAYIFGRVSLVSVLTNLLILPAQPPLMLMGILSTAAGLLWSPLGQMLAWFGYPFLWWTIRVVETTARLPFTSIETRLTLTGLLVIYSLLFSATWLVIRPGPVRTGLAAGWLRFTTRPLPRFALLAALASLVLATSFVRDRPDGRLHVTFLDVGEGEAILVETPTGRRILIDGGPDPSILKSHLGRRFPIWDRSLDLIIASHPDLAHVNGLPAVLENYRVGALITNGEVDGPNAWEEMLDMAEDGGIPTVTAIRGQSITTGDGVVLDVLHPTGRPAARYDNNSIVLHLRYGDLSFMLTGDIRAEAEASLFESGVPLQSIVLKAADGGDQAGTSQPFLDAVRPWVVVFSAGSSNLDRHPHPRVLERVLERGYAIGRTDELGSIHFASDGRQLWVMAEE